MGIRGISLSFSGPRDIFLSYEGSFDVKSSNQYTVGDLILL